MDKLVMLNEPLGRTLGWCITVSIRKYFFTFFTQSKLIFSSQTNYHCINNFIVQNSWILKCLRLRSWTIMVLMFLEIFYIILDSSRNVCH